MNDIQDKLPPTKEEREAKKEKSRWDAEKAIAERQKADDAFRANFERLKAERLAREKPVIARSANASAKDAKDTPYRDRR